MTRSALVLNVRATQTEWVDAAGPVDGVELFRARLRGRPFSRHRHDVYAIGVTEEGVQAFDYRGTVERSLPGQVFVLHPDELHDGRADGPGLFGYRQIYVNPDRIASALLDVARGWLRDARPLAESALEAGFADQAHFTRTFKAAFGMRTTGTGWP